MNTNQARQFAVKRGQRVAAACYVAIFAIWVILVVYVFATMAPRSARGAWVAEVITIGVPGAMLLLSVYFLLQMQSVVEIDSIGVRMMGPLGLKAFAWKEAVRFDLFGTEESGIRVFTALGQRVDVNFSFFDDADEMRQAILPNLPLDDGQVPLVSAMQSRALLSSVMLGLLGFFAVAGFAAKPIEAPYWVIVGMFGVLTLPLVAYAQTYRARLAGDVLSTTSCFGSKRIHLGKETQVSLTQLTVKGGKVWQLTAVGSNGTKIKLNGRMSRFTAFRDRLSTMGTVVIDPR